MASASGSKLETFTREHSSQHMFNVDLERFGGERENRVGPRLVWVEVALHEGPDSLQTHERTWQGIPAVFEDVRSIACLQWSLQLSI